MIFIALIVAMALWILTVPIARKVARAEKDPRLERLLMWAVTAHLLFAPISIWVVDHFYHGITDYTQYVNQGALLSHNFDSFHFTLANTNLRSPIGAGGVSIASGLVFAIVGVNKLAAFFVFGWLAFIASICFYRAYSVTFPEANHRRYALMIFFLPSLLFWTAGISKETVMYVSMGVAAYGAARIMAHRAGGGLLLILGAALGLYIRPQELVLFLAAVTAATVFRSSRGRKLGITRRIVVMLVQVGLLLVALTLAHKIRGPVFSLNTVSKNNTLGNGAVPYTTSPAGYPRDVYTVLFDPLPFNAHGAGQYVAAIENSIILTIIVLSWRRLRYSIRAAFMRPYVMACILFIAVWAYSFASLSNLGLIDRERVLMLPFLLVLLAIPLADKGNPPIYPWEQSRAKRRRQRRPSWSRRSVGV